MRDYNARQRAYDQVHALMMELNYRLPQGWTRSPTAYDSKILYSGAELQRYQSMNLPFPFLLPSSSIPLINGCLYCATRAQPANQTPTGHRNVKISSPTDKNSKTLRYWTISFNIPEKVKAYEAIGKYSRRWGASSTNKWEKILSMDLSTTLVVMVLHSQETTQYTLV